MQKQYIGDLDQYFQAQYAKSDRSTCRGCKQKINKNQLRLGIIFDDVKFTASYWFHVDCFHFKPRHKVLTPKHFQQHTVGIQDLTKADHDYVIKHMKQELKKLNQDRQLRQKVKQYEKVKNKNLTQKYQNQNKQNLNTNTKRRIIIKHHKKNVLNATQNRNYKKLVEQYEKYPTQQLRRILQKNDQVKSGQKDQLVLKCADGKQLGRIPICPKCGGGKLRFDRETGMYNCPGYMEDTDFVHCHAKFNFDEIKRSDWIQ